MSIYSTNILSGGLSVRLQKVKELRYLWMVSSLFNSLSVNISVTIERIVFFIICKYQLGLGWLKGYNALVGFRLFYFPFFLDVGGTIIYYVENLFLCLLVNIS